MEMQDFISEKEFAEEIQIPLSRLVKWRKYYNAPNHCIKRKVYYIREEFWNWFYTEVVFS